MKSFAILALSALLGFAAAAPLGKRDVVWVTVTEEVIEYVDSSTTYFVTAGNVAAATATSTDVVTTPTPRASKAEDPKPQDAQPKNPVPEAVVPPSAAPSAAPPASAPSSTSSATVTKDAAAGQFYAQPKDTTTTAPPAPIVSSPPTTSPIAPPAPSKEPESPPYSPPAPSTSASPPTSPAPATNTAPQTLQQSGPGASLPDYLVGGTAKTVCTAGSPCKGDMTTYNPSQGVGACGFKDTKGSIYTDEEMVVAISVKMMGSKSNNGGVGYASTDSNAMCGKQIMVKHPTTGKTGTATVVDKCFGCPGDNDIDFSPAFFKFITDGQTTGRFPGTEWWWL